MGADGDTFFSVFEQQKIQATFDLIGNQKAGANFAGASAGRALFLGGYLNGWPYPLTGDFHQSKLGHG
jgi:hypothetical protein